MEAGTDLMPFMGIGAAMYLQAVTTNGATSREAGVPIDAPSGIRHVLPLGTGSVGAEVSDIFWIGDLSART